MKVMVFVQIDPKDETGAMPSEELLAAAAIVAMVSAAQRAQTHGGTDAGSHGPWHSRARP